MEADGRRMEKILFNFRLKKVSCWSALRLVNEKNLPKGCQQEEATHTIDNDEQTANTHKNPNGNSGQKMNTNDEDKENQDTI